jgi:predicted nucleic acid-binding protein
MLLLDTNVVSELPKVRIGRADPNVAMWAETLDAATLFISVITVHELEIDVLLAERRDPSQGAVLRLWLETLVLRRLMAKSCRLTSLSANVPRNGMSPIRIRSMTH